MITMITVYVSIGNSDDKLTQADWCQFYAMVNGAVREHAWKIHGRWASMPDDPWQNACWCIEISDQEAVRLKGKLRLEAKAWRQDSIAWAPVAETEFLAYPAPAAVVDPAGQTGGTA